MVHTSANIKKKVKKEGNLITENESNFLSWEI